jgi:hypothetical protein
MNQSDCDTFAILHNHKIESIRYNYTYENILVIFNSDQAGEI